MNNRSTQISDENIVHLLKNGNKDGISLLYDKYASALFGVIQRILQNTEAAEEVLQDTILKIWNNAEKYDAERGNLLTWIINIARNAAIDRARLKSFNRRNEKIEDISHQLEEAAINPETIGVKDLMKKLNKEQQLIIDLIYFKGYTQSEAAEALEIPIGTVKSRLYAAIGKLREMF
ncbi:MAG: RNA polymerase sigma factor [Saprospiraceae bacterium]